MMTRAFVFRFLPILLLVLAPACHPLTPVPFEPDPDTSRAVWDLFTTQATRAENAASAFRLNATLYYSGKEDSQRVTTYFWGNGQKDAPYPLRLDILMGPGSIIAATREDSQGLFIYVPREETVYQAKDDGLLAFGVPLPFTLADLSALVTGRFSRIFLTDDASMPVASYTGTSGGDVAFTLRGVSLAGVLTLSDSGRPVAWSDGADNGWRLTLEYWPDSTRRTPRKLHIKHQGEGREATMIVRELTFSPTAYSEEQLSLSVPPSTRLATLDGPRQ